MEDAITMSRLAPAYLRDCSCTHYLALWCMPF